MHSPGLSDQVERRADRRFKTSFRVHWGREEGFKAEGEVLNLSVGGCFVIYGEKVNEGHLVSLQVEIPGYEPLTLLGTVLWVSDTGFGVRFEPFSYGGARDRLAIIIEELEQR